MLPTESTYKREETTRGITMLQTMQVDQPPTYLNQAANTDILDKVLTFVLVLSIEINIDNVLAASIHHLS